MLVAVWESVVKQAVARRNKHLCHHVFIYIAEIGGKVVIEQFLINDIFRKILVPER